MTPRIPRSVSISEGAPPDGMLAATSSSTNTLLPVAMSLLIVLLPVLAVKTYLPARVVQQGAAWPAAIAVLKTPSRNNPSWDECARVISAVPSGYTENPNGVRVPLGADTTAGAAPTTAP